MKYLCLLSMLWALAVGRHAYAQPFTISVEPLVPSVYVHTSYNLYGGQPFPSNGMIVETKKGVVLIDTPWDTAQTTQLIKWVSTYLKQRVVLAVVTHFHEDRLAGTEVLRRHGARVVSTRLTADLAKKEGFPVPDGILPNDTTLKVGGTSIETYFPGAGHAPDNIVVWLPKQKVLFGGCFIKSYEASSLGNLSDADLASWPAAMRRVHERYPKPAFVVPGHQSWKVTADAPTALPFGHPSLQHTVDMLERKGG
ncbi:subclass B1 metallo-beta-lactamase [Spirosoma soli]|uniref:beta-lactamase n=1 Tax=Spirosoma soli TaxID=1770529 RepID=A0ABW5LWL4_9BACT